MKFSKFMPILGAIVLFCSSSVMQAKLYILNKVEEASPIYIEVKYTDLWSPIIPKKKKVQLAFNNTMDLAGWVKYIHIRNVENETEAVTGGSRNVVSRISTFRLRDPRIEKACESYKEVSHKKDIKCFVDYLGSKGAYLENNALIVNEAVQGAGKDLHLVVTRHTNGKDFVIAEVREDKFLAFLTGADLGPLEPVE